MKITIIAALCVETRGVGVGGEVPWALHDHHQNLRLLTEGRIIIVGRKTYERLLLQGMAMQRRICLVLTNQDEFAYLEKSNVTGVYSLEDALERARASLPEKDREVFVLGGQETFELFLPLASTLHLTLITGDVPQCDRFFPVYGEDFSYTTQHGLTGRDHGLEYSFTTWERNKL